MLPRLPAPSSLPVFSILLAVGCARAPDPPEPALPLPGASSRYEAAAVGSVAGRVTWAGAVPQVAPFVIFPVVVGMEIEQLKQSRINPNTPAVQSESGAVGNAVVFLRGVDPGRARPWDQPPVRVEMSDFQFRIIQVPGQPGYGFVRRGDPVEMVSRQAAFHMLRASGAAFFSLAFRDPEQPLQRRFLQSGLVELSSAACYFWMRAYLFVDDQPYYTTTALDGRFVLADVPPGEYELICWLPNWNSASRDRDPESGVVLRHFYQPPLERGRKVRIETGKTTTAEFTVAAADFKR